MDHVTKLFIQNPVLHQIILGTGDWMWYNALKMTEFLYSLLTDYVYSLTYFKPPAIICKEGIKKYIYSFLQTFISSTLK